MIIKKPSPKKYGDYFLVFEADDEPKENIRNNMKKIDVKPNNRSKIDFRDGAEEADESDDNQPVSDDANNSTNNQDEQETQDIQNNQNNVDNDEDGQNQDDEPDTGGEQEDFSGDENPDDQNQDAESNPEGESDDEPDTGGEQEDFSGDENPDDQNQDAESNPEDQQASTNGPGLEYDSTRQYKLFLDYKDLHESIENYISALEMEIRDDDEIMTIYKKTTNRLREIKSLLYDYMTLKFTTSSYIQNLLFYQKMFTSVELLIEVLMKTIKSNN